MYNFRGIWVNKKNVAFSWQSMIWVAIVRRYKFIQLTTTIKYKLIMKWFQIHLSMNSWIVLACLRSVIVHASSTSMFQDTKTMLLIYQIRELFIHLSIGKYVIWLKITFVSVISSQHCKLSEKTWSPFWTFCMWSMQSGLGKVLEQMFWLVVVWPIRDDF